MNLNHCLFYVAGLLAALAYDEISFNKIATQSHNPLSGTGYDASNAVDGNTATCIRTIDIGGIARHNTVWWKVDLGGVYSIYSIRILYKNYPGYDNRQRGRFAGFSLYVSYNDVSTPADIQSSTLCYKDGPQLPPLNFSTICTEFGRYVIFYNERLNGVKYPNTYEVANVISELCEVTVQGCKNVSIYGSNCDTPCPTNCKDNTCHIQNGACFTCNPGWIGLYCNTKCGEGWYGINCSQPCVGHCRDRATCNHVTGQCDKGCAAGWTELQCIEACKEGYFGTNCSRVCSPKCKSDTCRHTDGSCTTCDAGYTGFNCTKACAQSYGDNCRQPCSLQCYNNTCDRFTGRCLLGCKDGFNGELCDRENVIKIQSMSIPIMFILGLSASVLINFILIVCGILLCRRNKSRKLDVSGNLLSCWNRSIYQDIVVKNEEASTYQELNLSGNTYQNTAV